MEAKVWYTSKTLWFNIITFTLAVLALTQFQGIIPASWLTYIAFATAIGNLILRMFFTSGPVTGTEQKAAEINATK